MNEIEAQLKQLNQELNPSQREGAETTEGPVMVIASAGSGKTKMLIHRVATLMVKGVPASNIMVVTFTNKAAKEIKNRLELMIGENGQYVVAGTFHGIIFKNILQAYGESEFLKAMGINMAECSILDEKDSSSILKEAIGELTPQELEIMEEKEMGTDFIEDIMSEERAKGRDVYDFFSSISPGVAQEAELRITANVWRKYNQKCREMNGIDFDDILLVADKLLHREKGLSKEISEKFKYLMLDEYQDTNPVQMSIMDYIASHHKNICVVGDEKQSIYGFRGADINVILTFMKRYPGATLVNMSDNYRSYESIIAFSNAIASAMNQKLSDGQMLANRKIEEDPQTLSRRRQDKCHLIEFNTDSSEAENIASAIIRDIALGVKPNEISVLYRNRALKNELERQLVDKNIKYKLVGDTSFYQRAEVKDVISMVRFVFNPWDSVAGIRLLKSTTMRVSPDAARKAMQESGINIHEYLRSQSEKRLSVKKKNETEAPLSETAKKVKPFLNLCQMARDCIKYGDDPTFIRDLLAEIWDIYLRPGIEKKEKANAENVSDIKTENVKHIFKKIHQSLIDGKGINDIIEDLSFMVENQGDNSNDAHNEIQLMTLHASKGLEFDNVYIIGQDSVTTHGENADENEIEESRRLFYVGATRAKKKLAVSYSLERMQYGMTIHPEKSPFIQEVEDRLGIKAINFEEQIEAAIAAAKIRESTSMAM